MYDGYPSSDLLQRCLLFDGLKSLSLEFKFEGPGIQQHMESSATVVDIFQTLGNLRYLNIDLREFPLRGRKSLENRLKPTASVLRKLQITGNADDLQELLRLDGLTSTSLLSLSVSVVGVGGLIWETLCDRVVSTLGSPIYTDLSSFISLSTFKSFRLDAVPHCLAGVNVISLADVWPGLRTFAIHNEHWVIFSATVLVALSRLAHLYEFALPLNLSDLEQPLPMGTPPANCPLRDLTVAHYSGVPSTWNRKIDLVMNIWMLFPMLNKVSAGDVKQQIYLDELQKLVQVLQSAIATRDHRRALCDHRRKLVVETATNHETNDREGDID